MMMRNLLLASAVLFSVTIVAQDGEFEQGNRRRNRRNFSRRQNRPPMERKDRTKAMEQLKKADAAAVAALEKEETSIKAKKMEYLTAAIEAEKKLEALAKKNKVELPETMESFRLKQEYLLAKYPTELAVSNNKENDFHERFRKMQERSAKMKELAEKEGFSFDPSAMMPGGRRDMRRPGGDMEEPERRPEGPGRGNPMSEMRQLKKAYPEEMKKVQELRAEGKKEEARELLKSLRQKLAEKNQTEKK